MEVGRCGRGCHRCSRLTGKRIATMSACQPLQVRGAYMCYSEQGHLEADQRVNKGKRHVLGIGIQTDYTGQLFQRTPAVRIQLLTFLDSMHRHKERNGDTLPEREEQDALDTKEFGCTRSALLRMCGLPPVRSVAEHLRTGRNGLRSCDTHTQNIARQLSYQRSHNEIDPSEPERRGEY